jgi:hypothetical protein
LNALSLCLENIAPMGRSYGIDAQYNTRVRSVPGTSISAARSLPASVSPVLTSITT